MFKPGDLVLVKMKGYSPWPAMVLPEDSVPKGVLDDKPGDGETFPVKFFNDPNYYWGSPTNTEPLDSQMCEKWLANKRNRTKSLRVAYEKAKPNPSLEQVMAETSVPSEDAGEEFEDADHQDEEEDEDADHEDVAAGDESEHDEPAPKRVKKSPAQNGKKEKVASGKKAGGEKKAASDKKSTTEKKPAKEKKPRAPRKKASKDVLPEDLPDDVKLAAVKASRVSLQKTLFARSDFPNDDELKACSDVLNRLEYFSSKKCISLAILKNTKIHKVLKAMLKVDQLKESKYEFHPRCLNLLDQWKDVLADLRAEKSSDSPGSKSPTKNADEHSSLANTSVVHEEGAADESTKHIPESEIVNADEGNNKTENHFDSFKQDVEMSEVVNEIEHPTVSQTQEDVEKTEPINSEINNSEIVNANDNGGVNETDISSKQTQEDVEKSEPVKQTESTVSLKESQENVEKSEPANSEIVNAKEINETENPSLKQEEVDKSEPVNETENLTDSTKQTQEDVEKSEHVNSEFSADEKGESQETSVVAPDFNEAADRKEDVSGEQKQGDVEDGQDKSTENGAELVSEDKSSTADVEASKDVPDVPKTTDAPQTLGETELSIRS